MKPTASPNRSARYDLDRCFNITTPWILSHQSYALTLPLQTPILDSSSLLNKPSQTPPPSQTLPEQVFALPLQLFFQYLSQPALEFPKLKILLRRFSLDLLASTFSKKDYRYVPDSIRMNDLQEALLKFRHWIETVYRHTEVQEIRRLYFWQTPPEEVQCDQKVNEILRLLVLVIANHYSELVEHQRVFTKLGLLCNYTNGLQYHLQNLSSLLDFIDKTRAQERYFREMKHFHFLYFNIQIALRAMKHVESICIQGKSKKMDPNPCFRYYIERFVLNGSLSVAVAQPTCYLIEADLISYFSLLNPEDQLLTKAFRSHYCSFFNSDPMIPPFLRKEKIYSFLSPHMHSEFYKAMMTIIVPYTILLFQKSPEVGKELIKLFQNEELNFFWKRMICYTKNLPLIIQKFEQWFQSMISCAGHCILEAKKNNKMKKNNNIYSKLLRATVIVIRSIKDDLPILQTKLYSDKTLQYRITEEDMLLISDFKTIKSFLLDEEGSKPPSK